MAAFQRADFSNIVSSVLSAGLGGNALLSIHGHEYYEANLAAYPKKSILLAYNGSDWQENWPNQVAVNSASEFKTVLDPTNGILYAAWLSNNNLYVSAQSTLFEWSVPVSVASLVEDFFVLSDQQGNAFVLWQVQGSADSIIVSQVTYSSNALSINAAIPVTVASGQLSDSPVIGANGKLSILWRVDASVESYFQLTQYQPSIGWDVDIAPLALPNLNPQLGLIRAKRDDAIVLVSKNWVTKRLAVTQFSNNAWTNWLPIDKSIDRQAAVMGMPKLVQNRAGDSMLLWIEESKDPAGGLSHQIMTSVYAGNMTSQQWDNPQLVATLSHHLHASYTPSLFIDDMGHALSAWIDSGAVMVSRYQPDRGWLKEPGFVAFTDYAEQGPAPTAIILPAGKMVSAWGENPINVAFAKEN